MFQHIQADDGIKCLSVQQLLNVHLDGIQLESCLLSFAIGKVHQLL